MTTNREIRVAVVVGGVWLILAFVFSLIVAFIATDFYDLNELLFRSIFVPLFLLVGLLPAVIGLGIRWVQQAKEEPEQQPASVDEAIDLLPEPYRTQIRKRLYRDGKQPASVDEAIEHLPEPYKAQIREAIRVLRMIREKR